jgi:hypothetical protein
MNQDPYEQTKRQAERAMLRSLQLWYLLAATFLAAAGLVMQNIPVGLAGVAFSVCFLGCGPLTCVYISQPPGTTGEIESR